MVLDDMKWIGLAQDMVQMWFSRATGMLYSCANPLREIPGIVGVFSLM
jgi:hypothetical protein